MFGKLSTVKRSNTYLPEAFVLIIVALNNILKAPTNIINRGAFLTLYLEEKISQYVELAYNNIVISGSLPYINNE